MGRNKQRTSTEENILEKKNVGRRWSAIRRMKIPQVDEKNTQRYGLHTEPTMDLFSRNLSPCWRKHCPIISNTKTWELQEFILRDTLPINIRQMKIHTKIYPYKYSSITRDLCRKGKLSFQRNHYEIETSEQRKCQWEGKFYLSSTAKRWLRSFQVSIYELRCVIWVIFWHCHQIAS